jgi:hypothetical protein
VRDGAAIAAALGGRRISNGWLFHCPAHRDDKRSCAIRNSDGLITCFAGCSRDEVAAALDALGLTDDGQQATADDWRTARKEAIATARTIWEEAAPPTWLADDDRARMEDRGRKQVEYYLRARGITLPVPSVMRYWNINGYVCAVQDLAGAITAIQCKKRGSKGVSYGWLGYGAVRLAEPVDGELGLAEGVETALSATQLTGVPCWATLGARRLDAVALPPGLGRIHLFGDNDDAGRAAVERATARYCDVERHKVRRWWPPSRHKDFNDVIRHRGRTA